MHPIWNTALWNVRAYWRCGLDGARLPALGAFMIEGEVAYRKLMGRLTGVAAVLAVAVAAAVSGCGSIMPRVAVPLTAHQNVVVEGFSDIRFRGDVLTAQATSMIERQYQQIARSSSGAGRRTSADFLAISGGGSDGAFSAGFLNGWTAAGTRPAFEIVTGVSTGALAAPFAFLGAEYDGALRRIYTEISDKDVYTSNGPLGVLGESLLDASPLRKIVEAELTDEMLDKIAAEYEVGRRLLIQTTDIERQVPYIWNITRIASQKSSDRRRLIADVLMASAAIPGVFPPVRINVNVDGHAIEELHVDGGVAAQVFFAPPGLDLARLETRYFGKPRDQRLVLIRNGKLTPETKATEPTTLSLGARAVSTLIKFQSLQDINKIRSAFARPGSNFKVASIPEKFTVVPTGLFDKDYMKALYKEGYKTGIHQGRHPGRPAEQ